MGFEAKVVLASAAKDTDAKLTTMQLVYPRFIHAELMTHREFSRNASSSRAIPVAKMIEQVRNNPAMPIHWGANQPGMQADQVLDQDLEKMVREFWLDAAHRAADNAEIMAQLGLHKQVANRILEPFQWMHTIITTASFSNWNGLRRHKDAQPEIKHLADLMAEAVAAEPVQVLSKDEWHMPYIREEDWTAACAHLRKGRITRDMPAKWEKEQLLLRISAARCARVSYLTHDGQVPTIETDLALFDRLAGAQPIHASPLEHQATPDTWNTGNPMYSEQWANPELHGNLTGWRQYRKFIKGEYIKE